MKNLRMLFVGCWLFVLLPACAFDVVHIKQIPVQMGSSVALNNSFRLGKEVNFSLGTGYSRKLNQGTKWICVGSISQGDIFKTNDQVLTVEGSNIYEAYIVVASGKLVGFYLPVEQSYCPLSEPKELYSGNI
jgi:hypothetical protein